MTRLRSDLWDTLWTNVSLATLHDAASYGEIPDGAIAVNDGRIAWIGRRSDLPAGYRARVVEDGRGCWLLPGLIAAALSSTLLVADPIEAQQRPRYGGRRFFPVPSEPPSYDGHREGTFGTVHPIAPHYNTLLRMVPRPTGRARGRYRTWPSPGRSRPTE